MADKSHDDLSEMLNQLAESQKRQEAELHELSGATHNRPMIDEEQVEAVLAGDSGGLSPGGAAAQAPVAEQPAGPASATEVIDADASADRAVAPRDERVGEVEQETEVDAEDEEVAQALADDQDLPTGNDADSADMLAALAHETGAAPSDEAAINLADESSAQPIDLGGATATSRGLPVPQPGPRRSARMHVKPAANLKAVFAPVFLTLGVLMLLPGIWAVLVLLGQDVWMSKAQGVDTMAKIMLVCWPVAIGLLAGAFIALVQLSRDKAKQRRREESMRR